MGIAPLSTVEFFCQSPEERRLMESRIHDVLASMPSVFMPRRRNLQEVVAEKPADSEKSGAKLYASLLSVDVGSCYGHLSVLPKNLRSPEDDDFDLSKQLCQQLLKAGLCSSVMLNRGCESKSMFGKRFEPAIIGAPDFAKLAVLKRFGYLEVSLLPDVVGVLNAAAAHEKYCENKWNELVTECRADSRFVPVLTPAGVKA